MSHVLFYKVSSSSNMVLRAFASAKGFSVLQPGREQQPLLLHSTMPRWHFPLPPGTLAVLGPNLSKISLNEIK